MKKLLLVLCALLCALSLIACSAAAPKEEKLEGSLEDMIAKMYETVDVNDETRNWLQSYVANIPFTGEECAYYLGFDGAPITEGIASEPMMTSQAYSLCLMRVEEGTDIEAFKDQIKSSVDPRKWVCVGVEEENVIVDNIGDVVVLIMYENSAAMHEAFLALKEA